MRRFGDHRYFYRTWLMVAQTHGLLLWGLVVVFAIG